MRPLDLGGVRQQGALVFLLLLLFVNIYFFFFYIFGRVAFSMKEAFTMMSERKMKFLKSL